MKYKNEDDILTDFITGKSVFNIGAELNRQKIEYFLVKKKGYSKSNIKVNAELKLLIDDMTYNSYIDLVVFVKQKAFIAIKCAAGSLDSRSREILSAARLYSNISIVPFSVVSDGENALIFDTMSGKKIGNYLENIPSVSKAKETFALYPNQLLSSQRIRKEKLIFFSYDSMNINISRKI